MKRKTLLSIALAVAASQSLNAMSVEYWWDSDYASVRVAAVTDGSATLDDFGEPFRRGIHILHMRTIGDDGLRGPVAQYLSFAERALRAERIIYWWDNRRDEAMNVPVVNGLAELTDFGERLDPGLHTLFMQPVYADGNGMGPVHQLFLPVQYNHLSVAGFEYWLDDDIASGKYLPAENGTAAFSLCLDDIEPGVHTLNVRTVAKNGYKSSLWQRIIISSPNYHNRVVAYRYRIGNVSGTVPVEGKWSAEQVITIPVPESDRLCNPADGVFTFDGNNVSLAAGLGTEIVLTPITDSGYTMPSLHETADLDGKVERTAANLEMNRHASVPRPAGELYEAAMMRFNAPGVAYLRPSATCDIRILNASGDIASQHVAAGTTIEFNHGTGPVYAVVHHAEGDDATVDLKLMALDNRVPAPHIAFDAGSVTMACDDPEAQIHYTLDGSEPTAASPVYEGQFTIDRNYPIRAVARVADMTDSDIAATTPQYFRMEPLTFSYNGRYLTLNAAREGASIVYDIDRGTEAQYSGEIELPGIATVNAHAEFPYLLNSEELTFTPQYHYDGTTATLTAGGKLADAFEWSGTDAIASLAVKGTVDDSDFATLRSLPALTALDLTDAKAAGGAMPADALARTALTSLALPRDITAAGNGIVRETTSLTSLRWNAAIPFTPAMAADQGNPNLLLYIADRSLAPVTINNVVAGGQAERLVLVPGYPFNCPEGFTAATASYTRSFNMKSGMGECAGWETISLPFNVERYVNGADTECAPFLPDGSYTLKPFWLYTLDESGWRRASTIEAHKPYIISMPNNEVYIDEWNLAGEMTFSAANVRIDPTAGIDAVSGVRTLHPSYTGEAEDAGRYVVNAYDEGGEYLPGSVFLPGWKAVAPFECYFTAADSPRRISIFGDFLGLESAYGDHAASGLRCRVQNGALYILSDTDRHVRIANTTGAVVRTADLTAGEEIRIDDLVHGFYLVENIKICIK